MTDAALQADLIPASNSFTAALCTALGRSLTGSGADPWQVTEEMAVATPAAPAFHFALTLEGEIAGQCFVSVSEADAAVLAAGADSQQQTELLLAALQTAANGAKESLPQRAGVTVRATSVTAVPGDAQPVARLTAASPAGGTGSLALLFDAQLLAALPRRMPGKAAAASPASVDPQNGNLGLVMDVELQVTLRFGQRQLALREVLDLASGSVVELDRQVDEPVELILAGRVIARGEAVIVDGNYGIRVTEVLQPVTM